MEKVRHKRCGCAEHWGAEKYSDKYDAIYCKQCDKWLESKCSDLHCEFCFDRPRKPSMGGLCSPRKG